MAKKIDIEIVQMVLKRTSLTELQQSQILEDLKFESKQVVGDDREPPEKKQFVVILNDPYGKLPKTGFEFSGWVVQIAEACEFGSAKLFKERKIWVRTKEPVLVLPTNGRIADVEEL